MRQHSASKNRPHKDKGGNLAKCGKSIEKRATRNTGGASLVPMMNWPVADGVGQLHCCPLIMSGADDRRMMTDYR
jgi:hypothetical protein